MTFWRREAQPYISRTARPREPFDGPTEAQVARIRAEEELARQIQRTAEVQAATPPIVKLGARLEMLRSTNHIRSDVIGALLKAAERSR